METETSQCSSLSSPNPQNPQEYIGCFVTLISKCDLRYDGVIYKLNLDDWRIGLQNVRCYGTEERGKNGLHIMPSNVVFEWVIFNGLQLKNVLVKPKGANIRQNVPLITNGNLEKPEKPQATTDSEVSLVTRSVNDRLQIASNPYVQPQLPGSNYFDPLSLPYGLLNQAPIYNALYPSAQPQLPGSYYYDPQSLPYGVLNQAPIYNASNPLSWSYGLAPIDNASNPHSLPYGVLNQASIDNASNPLSLPYGVLNQAPIYNTSKPMVTHTAPSQSFFSTDQPGPLPPRYGGVAYEKKDFSKYSIWCAFENKNQKDETASNLCDPTEKPDNEFGPIDKPSNEFGPIEKPVDYCEEIHKYLQWNPLVQQPPFSFLGGYSTVY
ncbi:hypothetical protein AALP_AA7G017600 [Arabis alpina]|uniref:Lsm14-like N-terminal domain-containing protein n=1 Tax=Arabis alpina TaxID=50452 RepID=A0A087GFE0_ARAAL|nr:hypothetical protein AALP_AA7G017600 [Arabis alpina]